MRSAMVLAGAGAMLLLGGSAWAAPSFGTPATPFSSAPRLGDTVMTPRGFGTVTGDMGSMGMVTIPGAAGQGMLMNNGNGTSTLLVPNGPPETLPTPQ
ncbi:MAG TPA: hypothetical protein VMB73_32535 [Acetobacteraceae bacterium]|jgi:hypothetical protein|nr:hypothetical protein [Acetobacteraceae bacterium]